MIAEHAVEQPEVAGAADAAQRLDQEPVAGEDRRRVAVDRARARLAAAGVGDVDDVVVEQGRGVDQLDRDRQLARAIVEAGAALGGQRHAHRPQVLAAEIEQVVGRGLHRAHAARHSPARRRSRAARRRSSGRARPGEGQVGRAAGLAHARSWVRHRDRAGGRAIAGGGGEGHRRLLRIHIIDAFRGFKYS
jgi:hypothetical protein